MGEIAELVLAGVLCMECGAIIDGSKIGFPRLCEECEE